VGAKVQKDYETAQGLTHIKRIIVIKCVKMGAYCPKMRIFACN
jgi:hypothetical protein